MLVHVAIEAGAGAMIAQAPRLIAAADHRDIAAGERGLSTAAHLLQS